MKSATIPAVRVEPELRAEVEALLADGETLSEFVESSVRQSVAQRRNQAEFVARALRALENTRRTGQSVDAEAVLDKLAQRLAVAKSARRAQTR